MAKLSEPVLKALETLMECHNNDTKTVVHLIARATKYGNSDEVELLRCANFNDILSDLVDLDLARSATDSTEILNEVKADKGILTEEELHEIDCEIYSSLDRAERAMLEKLIASHRNLLSANAELSFNNPVAKAKVKEYYLGLKGSVGKSGLTEMDVFHATQAIENVLNAFKIEIEDVNA